MTDSTGTAGPTVTVRLTSVSGATGGAVQFSSSAAGPFGNSLTVTVPTGGSSVNFFVAGKFGQPSTNRDDVTIEARAGSTLIGSVDLMVRIRKDANTLTNPERDRFIAAFATLNNRGLGRFADFRDMHTAVSQPQAHGAPGFLPWHRAYILDLERELQAIDPSVALPYWRFDQPAPSVFIREFMGVPDALGNVQFSPTNPLRFWSTDGVPGIVREPLFNTSTAAAFVIDEATTLALGADYQDFLNMEGDPHGNAHTSFSGSIDSVPTAARDPLFFLLHCNVDRLWAKWQKNNGRFDKAVAQSFFGDPTNPLGHNLGDTMWPWNGDINPPRPPTAPGGTLADSPCVPAPGRSPKVEDCLDYRGEVVSSSCMGFDYDDAS
jgi:tyrosinase